MPHELILALMALGLFTAYLAFSYMQRLFLGRNRFTRSISMVLNLSVLFLCFRLFLAWGGIALSAKANDWIISIEAVLLFYLTLKTVEFLVFDLVFASSARIQVPMLLRDIIRWLLALTVTFLIVRTNLGINLTPLLATSAALTFILGIAMQDVLGNLFAGIALNLEKPFSIGDWVMFKELTGQVENMTWRATKIRTFSDDYVIIPNSEIAKNAIINYSHPTPVHARDIRIGLDYNAPPTRVKQVIRHCCAEIAEIRTDPAPQVWLDNYGDFSITYNVRYWINDYARIFEIEDQLMTSIWYHLKRNNIAIPFPIRDVNLTAVTPQTRAAERKAWEARVLARLKSVPLLAAVPAAELKLLAAEQQPRKYRQGEDLVRQGAPGDSFYVIEAGTVEVLVRDQEGRETRVAELGQGKFFGEMSLLTGEARSATIRAVSDVDVLVIEKHDFAPILTRNPRALETLSKVIEQRQQENLEKVARTRQLSEEERQAASSASILKRMKSFFGMG